ncbi:MAG: aldehyde dehydrogenase family protein, partial [Desulfocapsa sp.]|nr:aldehyde dehydrogenase family protein [Desulfocapsa sp.]
MYHPDSLNLTDTEQVDEIMFQAMSAQDEYLHLDQNSIDRIVEHMAKTGASKHLSLAKQAIAETERGILEDKSITNILASSDFVKKLTDIQSVGIIEENEISGYQSIVEPVGVLASFPPSNLSIPSTLFQAILSVKTRNPIVFCFSPSVHSSSESAARLMQKVARDAGAPNFAIQWLSASSPKTIEALSKHPEINLILMDKTNTLSPATPLHVPVLGTGQINTPCFIDRSADMEQAVTDIIASRHFDNGLIPTSEQTIIISREIYFQCLDLLMQKSCHLVS